MSRKFDRDRPHEHKCPECHAKMYCRAAPCETPEWVECKHCRNSDVLCFEDGVIFYGTRDPRFRRNSERISPTDDFD